MTQLKDNNYFIIYGWMSMQLKLSGTQLLLYALIYNFNRTTKGIFYGSNSYIKQWFGIGSRNTIMSAATALAEKNLIYKRQLIIQGKKHNLYWINNATLPSSAEPISITNTDIDFTDISVKMYEENMYQALDATAELEVHPSAAQKLTVTTSNVDNDTVKNQPSQSQKVTVTRSKTVHNNYINKHNKKDNNKNIDIAVPTKAQHSKYEEAPNFDELFK